MLEQTEKLGSVPRWFQLAAGLGILWNLIGVGSYLAQVTMSAEAIAALPEAQRAMIDATPAWLTGVYAMAVFTGLAGAVLLLLRRKLAGPILAASLGLILVQFGTSIFVLNAVAVMGAGALVLPSFIALVAIGLLILARHARRARWLK
ncbi:MAG: hypothetical protein AAFR21_02915 [Pseudomonadota bacterium]